MQQEETLQLKSINYAGSSARPITEHSSHSSQERHGRVSSHLCFCCKVGEVMGNILKPLHGEKVVTFQLRLCC